MYIYIYIYIHVLILACPLFSAKISSQAVQSFPSWHIHCLQVIALLSANGGPRLCMPEGCSSAPFANSEHVFLRFLDSLEGVAAAASQCRSGRQRRCGSETGHQAKDFLHMVGLLRRAGSEARSRQLGGKAQESIAKARTPSGWHGWHRRVA